MKIIRLSKETNEIQRVIALSQARNKRYRYREFIIEGQVALDQAYCQGWKIKALFYNSEIALSPWAKKHLASNWCDVAYALPAALMEKISDKEDTPQLLAIGETRFQSFVDYLPQVDDVVLVLDEPKSAGNLGMVIRSAVAFGVKALVISGRGADEYDPKCIRSSVGTFFSLPIYHSEGVGKFSRQLEELKKKLSVRLIASGDKGSAPLDRVDFNGELLFLVLGNETSGVSFAYRQLADQFAKIALPGPFTSLNIGAAASIFLYEIFRTRSKVRLPI